jgi:ParB-like chromosome segregation protein Spo0J
MGNTTKKQPKKTFRNPIIQAREMHLEIEFHNLTKAQLARKLGISRARVTQILNLLKLPEELIREVEEMGDYWERRLVTERMLRRKIIVAQSETQSDLKSAGN